MEKSIENGRKLWIYSRKVACNNKMKDSRCLFLSLLLFSWKKFLLLYVSYKNLTLDKKNLIFLKINEMVNVVFAYIGASNIFWLN